MKKLELNQMSSVKANGLCALLSGGWYIACIAFKAAL